MPDRASLPPDWRRLPAVETAAPVPGSTTIGPFGSNLVAADYRPSGVPVVFVRDVRETGFEWRSEVYVEQRKAAELAAHSVEPGDLLATKMGLPPCVAAEYPRWMPRGVVTADIIRLRPNDALTDVRWLVRAVNSSDVQAQVRAITGGVTRPKVTLRDFRELRLPLPPLPEQRRIAEILDTVDEAIRNTEEIITKLKHVKLGLLHDLLTRGIDDNGELRDPDRHPEQFKDSPLGRIPKAWEVQRFGDLCESSAFGPRFSSGYYDPAGPLATLRTTDMDDEGNIDLSTMPRATIDPAAFSSHLLQREDLLISRSGTCGIAAVFPGHSLAVVPGAFLIRFRLREALMAHFYRRYFNSGLGRPRLDRLAVGGVQKNLNGSSVLALSVPVLPGSEVAGIRSHVSSIEEQEHGELAELAKLRLLKRGLMEDLLTGRVRVTALLEEAAE